MRNKLIIGSVVFVLAAVLAVTVLAAPTVTMTVELDADFSGNTGTFSVSILAEDPEDVITAKVTVLEDGEPFTPFYGWDLEGIGTASRTEQVLVRGGSVYTMSADVVINGVEHPTKTMEWTCPETKTAPTYALGQGKGDELTLVIQKVFALDLSSFAYLSYGELGAMDPEAMSPEERALLDLLGDTFLKTQEGEKLPVGYLYQGDTAYTLVEQPDGSLTLTEYQLVLDPDAQAQAEGTDLPLFRVVRTRNAVVPLGTMDLVYGEEPVTVEGAEFSLTSPAACTPVWREDGSLDLLLDGKPVAGVKKIPYENAETVGFYDNVFYDGVDLEKDHLDAILRLLTGKGRGEIDFMAGDGIEANFTLSVIPWPQDGTPETDNWFYAKGDMFYVLWWETNLFGAGNADILVDSFSLS